MEWNGCCIDQTLRFRPIAGVYWYSKILRCSQSLRPFVLNAEFSGFNDVSPQTIILLEQFATLILRENGPFAPEVYPIARAKNISDWRYNRR